MEENAAIVSAILLRLKEKVRPGINGYDLDQLASSLIKQYGAKSYNRGYKPKWAKKPFPAALCLSINGIILHGIPGNYKLREGDIATLDIGIIKNGLCGDAALTVPVGKISPRNERLLYYAKKAVYEYISYLVPGANTRDIAVHMENFALRNGYTMNRRGSGHHIGKEMHEKPSLYNTVEDDVHTYGIIKEGAYVCVEPILTLSKDSIGVVLSDGWSVATMDRQPGAMYEHMVQITKNGPKILTTHFDNE
jgi:methionyl aminopeptidase